MLMYEYYSGHAGDTGGYGVSIYVHCNRLGFWDGCMGGCGGFYFNNLYDSIILKLRLVMSFYE